jgi:molybdate/tungstate transport system substrate-binding protein
MSPGKYVRGRSETTFGERPKKVAISTIAVVVVIVVIIIVAAGAAFYFASSSTSTTTSSSTSSSSSVSSATSSSSSSSGSRSALILYSADAYVNESTRLANAFSNTSGIAFAPPKSAGSSALGQQIAEGNPVSVFISVSKTAVQNTTLKNESSGWAVAFATDQMGLAYTNSSGQSQTVTAVVNSFKSAVTSNTTGAWYDFYSNLTSGQVKVGISNPNADPAGYRAWIVLEAAGKNYANNSSYFVNRIRSNGGNVTGASAADLVAPLQSGNIQFLFIYKSDISSLKLNLLQLPSAVNLGSPSYNTYYSQFTYNTTTGLQKGSAIVLWITVPKDSTNYNESVQFVVFVLQNYKTILSGFGLVYISPPKLYNDTSSDVPTELGQLLGQGSLAYAGPL